MTHWHPRRDEHGARVALWQPHAPTPLDTWADAKACATVVPDGPMPEAVCALPFVPWREAPRDGAGWEHLAAQATFGEPKFVPAPGKKPASGAVIVEPDGRVWVVAPSNRHGGYAATFPKGTLDPKAGLSLRANAIKEAHEEAGLAIELTGFLVDAQRTQTTTRYYLARRVGGCPSTMGWESQAVHLVPRSQLAALVDHAKDRPVLAALAAAL
ncbi:MAG: NUDIX hydrolase [Burkholderiales bacterium]